MQGCVASGNALPSTIIRGRSVVIRSCPQRIYAGVFTSLWHPTTHHLYGTNLLRWARLGKGMATFTISYLFYPQGFSAGQPAAH